MRPKFIISGAAALAAALLAWRLLYPNDRYTPPQPPAGSVQGELKRQMDQRLAAVAKHGRDGESLRKLGRFYQANGFSALAADCFARMAQVGAPIDATDHYLWARALLDGGNLDVATARLTEAKRLAPDYLPAQILLAETLRKSGRAQEAESVYREIVQRAPAEASAVVGLAQLEIARGADQEAVAHLENLIKTRADTPSATALLAQVYRRTGHSERAQQLSSHLSQRPEPMQEDPWQDALISECYDPQKLSLECEKLIYAGRLPQAQTVADQLAQVAPKHPMVSIVRGYQHLNHQRLEEGIKEYQQALLNGGDPDQIVPIVIRVLLQSRRAAESLVFAKTQFEQHPQSDRLLETYAKTAEATQSLELAAQLYGQLIQRDAKNYAANMYFARESATKGDLKAAIERLQIAAASSPLDIPSRALLGDYLLQLNDPERAFGYLQEIGSVETLSADYRANLDGLFLRAAMLSAESAYQANHYEQAESYCRRAIQRRPEDPAAYAALAQILAAEKKFPAAVETLQALVKITPNNPTVHLSLGDLQASLGQRPEAENSWKRARELAKPDDADLRAALAQRLNGAE